jgi:hypothetical protein
MCVRGIDCVSVSVILGLGFGTVLTLLCVVCHFITLFDHWILTITLRKTLCTTKIISPFRITLFDFTTHYLCFTLALQYNWWCSWLITGFVTRLTRRMPLVERELLSLPAHLNSLPVLSGVRLREVHTYKNNWRYQRCNRNPYIEEEQTTQWSKEKVQKDKQRSTKHTSKTTDRVARTPLSTQVLRKEMMVFPENVLINVFIVIIVCYKNII